VTDWAGCYECAAELFRKPFDPPELAAIRVDVAGETHSFKALKRVEAKWLGHCIILLHHVDELRVMNRELTALLRAREGSCERAAAKHLQDAHSWTASRRAAWKQLARRLWYRAKGTPNYQAAFTRGVQLLEANDELRVENARLREERDAFAFLSIRLFNNIDNSHDELEGDEFSAIHRWLREALEGKGT
jgi:hypothetical protein